MARLEDLTKGALVRGILGDRVVKVVDIAWHGSSAVTLTFTDELTGKAAQELLDREDEARLTVEKTGRAWSLDADGELFRLVSEARRIHSPTCSIRTWRSRPRTLDPLPHQIDAVYGEMLPRQPLRFLLADDPGAGKTIMAGLLIKELMVRGDLERCLIVAPGSLVEQWQDELCAEVRASTSRSSPSDMIEAARSGNPFAEKPPADRPARPAHRATRICRPSSRQTDWDLVVVDEAHKMSAHYYRRRGQGDQALPARRAARPLTRHFLLMTATPHTGKEEDFQLFMALLDADRFEGKPRDGVAHGRPVGPDAADGQGGAARRSTAGRCSPSAAPTRSIYPLSDDEAAALQAGHRLRARGDEPRRPAQGGGRGQPRRHRRLRAHRPAAPARLLAGGDLPVAAPSAASGWRSDSPRSRSGGAASELAAWKARPATSAASTTTSTSTTSPRASSRSSRRSSSTRRQRRAPSPSSKPRSPPCAVSRSSPASVRDSGTDRKWDELSRLAPGQRPRCSTRTAAGAS